MIPKILLSNHGSLNNNCTSCFTSPVDLIWLYEMRKACQGLKYGKWEKEDYENWGNY